MITEFTIWQILTDTDLMVENEPSGALSFLILKSSINIEWHWHNRHYTDNLGKKVSDSNSNAEQWIQITYQNIDLFNWFVYYVDSTCMCWPESCSSLCANYSQQVFSFVCCPIVADSRTMKSKEIQSVLHIRMDDSRNG